MIQPALESFVSETTGATEVTLNEIVQELWSGYGKILRLDLRGAASPSLIAKHISAPTQRSHPRGWVTDLSHERKLRSYQVELAFYQHFSSRCEDECRIPCFLDCRKEGNEVFLLLEDLNEAGFPARLRSVDWHQIEACLRWLAKFHALFLGSSPTGLWETGTYWHLETRPDELAALEDPDLKEAAKKIDARLSEAKYQTFVHGDAKLANFCFSRDGRKVAALDFQYVGRGCGMKDVAYFIGSCLEEEACELEEARLLDTYFSFLIPSLTEQYPSMDVSELEREWRELFPIAWTDFHRFLKGWCPGHWKINGYSERIAREVIAQLS
ncbi:MAG: phosphotransferase [Verrucomicrobiota bacterium]